MTGALFEISFFLAAPFWLLMILAPNWRPTARIAASPLTVLPVLALYLVMAVPVFPELWDAVRSPDIDTFRDLTALANGAGAIWAQVIAWDLLLGQWMFLEGQPAGDLSAGDGATAGADDSAVALRAAGLSRATGGAAAEDPVRERNPGPGRSRVAAVRAPVRRTSGTSGTSGSTARPPPPQGPEGLPRG